MKPLQISLSDPNRKTRLLTRLHKSSQTSGPSQLQKFPRISFALYLSEMSSNSARVPLRVLSRLQWAFDQKTQTREEGGSWRDSFTR